MDIIDIVRGVNGKCSVKALFERILVSVPRSPLYMGAATGLDIALVTQQLCLSKATVQQVKSTGHGPTLDEDVTCRNRK